MLRLLPDVSEMLGWVLLRKNPIVLVLLVVRLPRLLVAQKLSGELNLLLALVLLVRLRVSISVRFLLSALETLRVSFHVTFVHLVGLVQLIPVRVRWIHDRVQVVVLDRLLEVVLVLVSSLAS